MLSAIRCFTSNGPKCLNKPTVLLTKSLSATEYRGYKPLRNIAPSISSTQFSSKKFTSVNCAPFLAHMLHLRAFMNGVTPRSMTTTPIVTTKTALLLQRKFSSGDNNPNKQKSPINWKSVLVMGVVGVSLIMYTKYYRGTQHKNAVQVRTYGKPALGGPFELVDYDGKRVTNDTFLGEYVLIYFGFTSCPDICPTELQKMKKALALAAKEKDLPHIRPVFITIDPERDTPIVMKKYHQENDYPADMVWLTGTMDKIDAAAKQFHVYYSIPTLDERQGDNDYLVDHSIFFYLMGADGQFMEFFGKNMTATEVAEKMARVLRESGYKKE